MKARFLILFLWAILMSSCMTVDRIQRNCDKFAAICVPETEKVIEYRDTTIYRLDTIRVPLHVRDTVRLSDTIRIVNNVAWLPPIRKQIGLIGVDAWVNHSILNVNAYLNDSTILYPVRDTITIEKAIKEEQVTNTVVVEKRYVPKLYHLAFWIVVLELVAMGIWLAVKFSLIDRIRQIKL